MSRGRDRASTAARMRVHSLASSLVACFPCALPTLLPPGPQALLLVPVRRALARCMPALLRTHAFKRLPPGAKQRVMGLARAGLGVGSAGRVEGAIA